MEYNCSRAELQGTRSGVFRLVLSVDQTLIVRGLGEGGLELTSDIPHMTGCEPVLSFGYSPKLFVNTTTREKLQYA